MQPQDFGIGRLYWSVPEAILIGEVASGRIVLLNPVAEALFGYSAAEASGLPLETLVPERFKPQHRAGLARYLASGHGPLIDSGKAVELTAQTKDGREIAIELILSPIEQASIEGRFVVAVIRDITERKLAEHARAALAAEQAARLHAEAAEARGRAEREQSQRRLTMLAEASEILASSLDYETTLRNVAQLAMPLLGDFGFFDVAEDDGQVRRICYAHQDPARQALLEATRWARSTRTDSNLCALSSGKTGVHPEIGQAWLEDVALSAEHLVLMRELGFRSMLTVPLHYQGRVLGALTLFYGASGRHHTPDDVALAEELAHRAAAAVANASLFKQAQEAIAARDEFLSVAAHELRTPLTTLTAHTQLLLRATEKADSLERATAQRSLHSIQQHADRLARLISHLLDSSRLDAGKLQLERQHTDLKPLVDDASASAQARTTHHTIKVDAPGKLEAIIDPLRLEQVLANLLENAIKYSPDGGAIDVSLARTGRETAEIAVRDYGLGIPPERRSHIFERFYQAHGDSHSSGMGLGLYISRQIVELHGGELSAEFPEDGGSCFVVRLPLTASQPVC